jgi:hypothetical protein
MPLTITSEAISGDHTSHTARPAPGHQRAWEVSWLPGRLLDRNSAITAMVLAEVVGSRPLQAGDRLWLHIEGWAAEIGLAAPEALARICQPSGTVSVGKDEAAHSEPEAGS